MASAAGRATAPANVAPQEAYRKYMHAIPDFDQVVRPNLTPATENRYKAFLKVVEELEKLMNRSNTSQMTNNGAAFVHNRLTSQTPPIGDNYYIIDGVALPDGMRWDREDMEVIRAKALHVGGGNNQSMRDKLAPHIVAFSAFPRLRGLKPVLYTYHNNQIDILGPVPVYRPTPAERDNQLDREKHGLDPDADLGDRKGLRDKLVAKKKRDAKQAVKDEEELSTQKEKRKRDESPSAAAGFPAPQRGRAR